MSFRAGVAPIMGRPNVGKSTLLNRMLKEKVSIETRKPQTTRHAITGVRNDGDAQLVLVDTPGLHAPDKRLLSRNMNRAALGALAGADIVLLVVEAGRWTRADDRVLNEAVKARLKCVLVVNKIDRMQRREDLFPYLELCGGKADFAEIIPVSALHGDNLERLHQIVADYLPEGEPLFPDGSVTDRDMGFRIAEMLREKLTLNTHREVPYDLDVVATTLETRGRAVVAELEVRVNRVSQRGIVIGRGGLRLKAAARQARLELQRIFRRPFHIRAHVRVRKNWFNNPRFCQ
ncbi:MAG: GTPase Era [Gammaproteobacteria bacterium]|nr:GTPase Era [Gammaproteobacteria bacterium]MCY4255750.1 GTPase Era [Gammaproteobacteria bacterium]